MVLSRTRFSRLISLATLGSEDWCDAIHAGVPGFLTADRQCTERLCWHDEPRGFFLLSHHVKPTRRRPHEPYIHYRSPHAALLRCARPLSFHTGRATACGSPQRDAAATGTPTVVGIWATGTATCTPGYAPAPPPCAATGAATGSPRSPPKPRSSSSLSPRRVYTLERLPAPSDEGGGHPRSAHTPWWRRWALLL